MKPILPLIVALSATPCLAEETRHVDAHEHGVGALDIAFDGSNIAMAFHAPGADIVGFEHAPHDPEDHAAIDTAIAILSDPLSLFTLSDDAGCTVVGALAELEAEEDHDEEHDDDAHEDHDAEHEEHDHDNEHEEEAGHTEFHAEYALTCADPSAINEITFAYFEAFENAREVEVQIVTTSGAQAFEVTPEAPTLDLSDLN